MKGLVGLRGAAVPGLALVAIAFGGSAIAAWTEAGSGTGSSDTGTTVPVTLSPAVATSQLSPGGPADAHLTVSNPNPSSVRVVSLELDTGQGTGGFAVDAGHSGCGTSALGFTTQTNGGNGWTVAAQVGGVDGSLPVDLTNALTMDSGAANACQGASFTVYLAASL